MSNSNIVDIGLPSKVGAWLNCVFPAQSTGPKGPPGVEDARLDLQACEVENVLYYICTGVLRHDSQNHQRTPA